MARLKLRRRQHGEPAATDVASGPGPLAGQVFVLTGTLSTMTREQAQQALEQLGLSDASPGR